MRKTLAVLLAALAGLVTASGCGTFAPPGMKVTAQFRDSVGLYVGNDVAMLGIPVGKVTRVQPKGTHVSVDLELDAGTTVPAGAGAVTVSPSVVTDRHIELTPAYRGGPVLRDGDVIPVERTRTPVEFDRVLKAVDQLSAELSATDGGSGAVRDATGVAAANLAGNGDRIRTTIEALSAAVDVGTHQRDPLISLVKNVDRLTSAAAENDAKIKSFGPDLAAAVELFSGEAPQLGAALRELNGLLDDTTQLINENRATAQASLAKLRVTTGTLAQHSRDLAESIDVLPLLSQNVAAAVDTENGQLRVHADLAETLLDGQLVQGLCLTVGIKLPGCQTGKAADFGPDLGMTEILLGGVMRK